MRTSRIIIALAAALLSFSTITAKEPDSKTLYQQFQNPDNRYRPFVRWWWNGDRVEAKELIRELHLLKDVGIGGVEINPISLPSGSDSLDTKPLEWLSDEWIEMVKTVFDEAEKIGMTCDMIVGSGWPFGNELLPRDQRAEVMLTYAADVEGGKRFEISDYALCRNVDPGVTEVNPRRTPEIVKVYLTPNPISDISQAIDLTDKFKDGILSIDVPEGKWEIYALIKYESFACVINGAPGAAGSILNHMDAAAVRGYLDHMSDTIESKIGPLSKHLRAFFVDSMELEGANWTADFAEQFKSRRGYDVLPWLPFTMFKVGRLGNVESFEYGAKKSDDFQEKVNRVRFDFELTKAELLNERYTDTYLKWCKDKGVKSRAQAYGNGFFIEESSLGYDIPEAESWTTNWLRHKVGEEMGDEDYRKGRAYTMINKYVSSAAHLTGKRIISSEEMTNTYKVFTTSLEFLKLGSDMNAFAGITHSVWHGFNYSPLEATFPGWVQYGSFYNERNPWWPYFRLLNDYRARMSSLLQNSDMYTDIAILPANYDMWTEMGVQTEPFPVKLNVPYTSLIWEAIHKNGGGADYVSENILKDATIKDGKICYGPKSYGVLILPDVAGTTVETVQKLQEFVRQGGRVFCIGQYPSKSLGLDNYKERDKEIEDGVEELKKYPDNFILLEKPADGKYLEWYKGIMEKYSLPHAITITDPDRFVLQSHFVGCDKSDMFLLENANINEGRKAEIIFPKSMISGRHLWLYDPSDGKRYTVPMKDGKVTLDFGPAESVILVLNKLGGTAPAWTRLPASGTDSIRVDRWAMSAHHQQEGWTKESVLDTLQDFKTMKDSSYVNFMGDITYKTTVSLEDGKMPKYINLGKVGEIADLTINGQMVGTLWYGRRIADISKFVKPGENTIEVKVTTLTGNYLQKMKDNKNAQRFILRRNQPYTATGLIGPVTLYK